ncbi:MAG: hypothetical protein HKP25_10630 [Marinicaulis sp.]|nr:hypothetical protein [Marinicaulis sp.]NNL89516.1 hypothetical protein [Marinicaulis sp.]
MDRRKFVARTGGLIIASGAINSAAAKSEKEMVMPGKACRPVTMQTPGPFVTQENIVRSDIREDLPGAVLNLNIRVLDPVSCAPTEGMIVDIWQCDAAGRYAGFVNINFDLNTLKVSGPGPDYTDKTFLRGRQLTDQNGLARFTTIIPGWYIPRLPHIHVRATIPGMDWTATTTQLYFPPDLEKAIYDSPPYAERGPNPIGYKRDLAIRGDKKTLKALTLDVEKDSDGFKSTFDMPIT